MSTTQPEPVADLGYARARFAPAVATATAGALLAIGAFTFDAPTERWLAFGVGCGVLVVVASAFAVPGRGAVQRVLDLPLVLVCGWAIVCSRAVESGGAGASPGAVKWWGIALGAAIWAFGAVGLLLHERGNELDMRSRGAAGAAGAAATERERYSDALARATGR